jgi:hypothetical protein
MPLNLTRHRVPPSFAQSGIRFHSESAEPQRTPPPWRTYPGRITAPKHQEWSRTPLLRRQRHDKVQRTIEAQGEKGVMTLPQIEEVSNPGLGLKPKTIAVYNIETGNVWSFWGCIQFWRYPTS